MSLKTSLRRVFSPILHQCEGVSAVLVATLLPLLLLTSFFVVDMGRIYVARNKAQNASDAALLGAVATAGVTDLRQEMLNLLATNFPPNYMGAQIGPVSVSTIRPQPGSTVSQIYESRFVLTVPLTIPVLFGDASRMTIISQASRVASRRLEVALVLDNTGSMNTLTTGGETRIAALRDAMRSLINILFSGADTQDNLSVSVIPYNTGVNVGPGRSDWVKSAFLPTFQNGAAEVAPGVLSVRNLDYPIEPMSVDVNDAPPTDEATRFRTPYGGFSRQFFLDPLTIAAFAVEDTSEPGLAPLIFANQSRQQLINYLPQLRAVGTTRVNAGLQWGWMTLSSRWQGVWDSARPFLPRSPAALNYKVIILMTDGENTVFPPLFGFSVDRYNPADDSWERVPELEVDPIVTSRVSNDNVTTLALCNAIKASPDSITIYTIALGTARGSPADNLMRDCATGPGTYFNAPDGEALRSAFYAIGQEIRINYIRLSR